MTRLSVRSLTRSPGLGAIAVVAFTVGIALTTATFSILDGVVLKGLPIEKANELVHMEVSDLPAGINSVGVLRMFCGSCSRRGSSSSASASRLGSRST